MKSITKKALVTGMALAGSVQAAPLYITQWSVGVNTYFDTNSILPTSGITSTGDPATSLNWGTPAVDGGSQSGLDIGNTPTTSTVETSILPNLLAPGSNVTIIHRNQPIFAPSLASVDIISALTLTPTNPLNGAQLGPVNQTFKITFLETPNNPTNNICADGSSRLTDPLNANGCADIFVIDRSALNFAFQYAAIVEDGLGNLSFSQTETTTYSSAFLK